MKMTTKENKRLLIHGHIVKIMKRYVLEMSILGKEIDKESQHMLHKTDNCWNSSATLIEKCAYRIIELSTQAIELTTDMNYEEDINDPDCYICQQMIEELKNY